MKSPAGSPLRTHGVLSDFGAFFIHRPEIATLVPTGSEESRREYTERIHQRLPIAIDQYAVLNIHRIGIDAPVSLVYDELARWSGESPCWPDHIATVENVNGSLEHIRIVAFGSWIRWLRDNIRQLNTDFGLLFRMTALEFKHTSEPVDVDNARYLLYKCSGGYPIGVFCMYARSAVESLAEPEQTQLFLAVSFNFYGREKGLVPSVMHKVWQGIHNRVTANVMNRFKRLFEARFASLKAGDSLG